MHVRGAESRRELIQQVREIRDDLRIEDVAHFALLRIYLKFSQGTRNSRQKMAENPWILQQTITQRRYFKLVEY